MEFSPEQMKVLQKVTTEAALDCSRSFSKWVNGGIEVKMRPATIVPFEKTVEGLDWLGEVAVGLFLNIEQGLAGSVLILFSEPSSLHLADLLCGQKPGTTTELGDLQRSALLETGNILACAYLNSVGKNLSVDTILPGPPLLLHDIGASIVDSVMAELAVWQKEAILVHVDFKHASIELESRFFMLPRFETLAKALEGPLPAAA